ncbi:MAG TPA: hypothetical protein VJC18_11905, partial [bacterium]|nr:hypothetical protein [bacterium]
MSVILKALKRAENDPSPATTDNDSDEGLFADNDGGFFEGKDAFVKKSVLPITSSAISSGGLKTGHILLAGVVLALSFLLTLRYIMNPHLATNVIPNTIEFLPATNTAQTTTSATTTLATPHQPLPDNLAQQAQVAFEQQ